VVSSEVLHTQDHKRYGTRAFLRLELTDDALIVVVHELGPPHVRDDSQARRDAWHIWPEQLEPPAVTDDVGTTYAPSRQRRAVGPGGSPGTDRTPLKATVSWRFLPSPPSQALRWTIDGRWTVERSPA
jgi:hypothetical protein